MHRGHLIACAVGFALALALIAMTGATAAGIGLLVVAIACPIAMVLIMKLLMGDLMSVRPFDPGERNQRDDDVSAV